MWTHLAIKPSLLRVAAGAPNLLAMLPPVRAQPSSVLARVGFWRHAMAPSSTSRVQLIRGLAAGRVKGSSGKERRREAASQLLEPALREISPGHINVDVVTEGNPLPSDPCVPSVCTCRGRGRSMKIVALI
jgi:hypothetical protein